MTLREKVLATDFQAWNDPKFGTRGSWISSGVSFIIVSILLYPDFGSFGVPEAIGMFLLILFGISIFAVIDERRGAPE